MRSRMLVALTMIGLAACSGSGAPGTKDAATGTASKAAMTLKAGTTIEAITQRTISSVADKAGDTFTASVTENISDANGRVLVPAGATLQLVITKIEAAVDRSAKDGKLTVEVRSLTVGSETYPVDGVITSLAHTLKGVGVGNTEVEKTAAGAVLGAVAGKIVGGDQRGVIIGTVIGGAAGAAVARETANREVVVANGTTIVVTLNGPITLASK